MAQSDDPNRGDAGDKGAFDKALASYDFEGALQIAQNRKSAAEDSAERARALIDEATALRRLDRASDSLARAQEAVILAREVQEPDLASAALIAKGYSLTRSRDFAAAISAHDEALEFARLAHNRRNEAKALAGKGSALRQIGQGDDSIAAYDAALRIADELQDDNLAADALGGLGHSLFNAERYEEAISALDRAIALAHETKNQIVEGHALDIKADALAQVGKRAESLPLTERALTLGRSAKSMPLQQNALASLVRTLSALGRGREARQAAQEAVEIAGKRNDPFQLASALNRLGMTCEADGDREGGVDAYRKALAAAVEGRNGPAAVEAQASLRRLTPSQSSHQRQVRRVTSQSAEGPDRPNREQRQLERLIRIYGEGIHRHRPKDLGFDEWLDSLLPVSRVQTAVLICDIRGYTTVLARLDPEDQLRELNSFLLSATQCVRDRGGGVDKYMGDAILAFFLPTNVNKSTREDESEAAAAAIQAASDIIENKEIRARFDILRRSTILEDSDEFGVGVGLAFGVAKFGEIGEPSRFEYTLIGRAVNLASRVQQEARAWEVVSTRWLWEVAQPSTNVSSFVAESRPRREEYAKSMKGFENEALVKICRKSS